MVRRGDGVPGSDDRGEYAAKVRPDRRTVRRTTDDDEGVTTMTGTGIFQELFDAVTSLLATVFVTWMIFWMRRASRSLSGELRARLDEAIQVGTGAVVVMAFLAVAREGLETALLFFASVQGATTSATPLIGITLGILTAVVLGWGLYRSALRINLTVFFTWTGLLLILVAAGIFKYGVHDLQEANVLPGLSNYAFDISSVRGLNSPMA